MKRQREQGDETRYALVAAIRRFTRAHGYAPTVRELGALTGLRSANTVYFHLLRMEEAGWVTWEPGKSRTIRLTPAAPRKAPAWVKRYAGGGR